MMLVVIGIAVLLHSARFHQYVLKTAQKKASASLGTQVFIRDFTLNFSGISPTLDLFGVTVDGAAPYSQPPLIQVAHATVGVRIVSLLHRKWYLSDVEMHQPIVRVYVDKAGQNNLPRSNKNSGGSTLNLFDLAIQHALLDGGAIYYNDRKSALDADVHNVEFRSSFDMGAQRYSGTLSYSDGRLQMGNFNPILHDFKATFNATPQRFTIESAELHSERSFIALKGTVEDYSSPKIAATYDALVDSGQFRRILKNATLPSGMLHLAGDLHYDMQPNIPALKAVVLNGTLSSSSLDVHTPSVQTTIRNLLAYYSLNGGNAEVKDLRANLLGGTLTGTLQVRDLTGSSRSHLQATLRGAQLSAAKSLLNSPTAMQVSLNGTMNAAADATWGRTFDDLTAKADATLNGNMSPAANGAAQTPTPLAGMVHARYSAATKSLTLANSYLRTPQTQLSLNGTVGDHSLLQVRLHANDLHELDALAQSFQKQGATQQPLGLYGAADFTGTVRGSTTAPEVAGQLVATNLHVRGTEWKLLRTRIDASPSQMSLQNGELDAVKHGRLSFNLQAALRNWGFTSQSPFKANVNGSDLQIGELARAAGVQSPVSGTLSTNIQAHGTESSPFGSGTLQVSNAVVSGENIQSATAKFQAAGDVVHADAQAHMAAGSAHAIFTVQPKQRTYDLKLNADGIKLEQLQAIKARGLQIAGVLNLDASGRGSFDDPQLTARLQVPQLKVQDQTISAIMLNTTVADHVAKFALDSQALGAQVRGRGTVRLTGDYYTEASLDTQRIPLQPLVAAFAPSQAANVNGATELHAIIRGPLKNKNQLEVHAIVPVLAVDYKKTVQIAAASPIHIDMANGVLNLQRTTIRGTDTNLQLQASVPMANNAPASLLAQGTVDLALAQLFDPDIVSSGQLHFDINSYGARLNPNVQGKIEIVNAALATGTTPVGLQNGNGELTLRGDRLEITKFTGTVGGGTVSAAGAVVYRPTVQFDLAITGREIRMLVPPGVRTGIDTRMTLTGSMDSALLSGLINLDQISFAPDFDLMGVMAQFGGTSSAPPAQGFANNLQLQLAVRSTNGINLASRELSIQGGANLNVRGTAADPVIIGRLDMTGGDLIFRGNRYVLEGGTIDFTDPSRTHPVLNVNVSTTVSQYNITMRFEGPVEQMRTSYTSDPSLPPADIINLLAFGKTSEETAANPNPPGNLGAESAIASAVTGQVTSRISKIAGISQLSIDPALGGNQQNPGAVITVQQRVTGKIFVTFSTDVTGTGREAIQVEYKKSPRLSFSGTRDQNGGFAFDTRIHKSW